MKKRIFREYILPINIVILAIGILLLTMGTIWIWFNGLKLNGFTDLVYLIGGYNYWLFGIGIILVGIAIWYIFDFYRKKKFLLEEIKTDKRSEFIKKHLELEETVKYLPSKYKEMLEEKKKELRIK
jgi:type VI protein secretion system component VasK